MNNILKLMREDLRQFDSYHSARSIAQTGKIMLDANELPWNNSLNRYPLQQPHELLKLLASYYQLATDQLLITPGSDEAIDLLIRLFCYANRDAIMICPPTFGMYALRAKLQAANVISVPLNEKQAFQLDITSIIRLWTPTVKIIFICSPNNPTGNLIEEDDILFLCKYFIEKSLIVVDEAYIEFSNRNSFSQYINHYENLIVLRTLSKAFGLAGARIGAALSNSTIIYWLRKILSPYPLSALSIQAATKVFQPNQLIAIKNKIKIIQEEREKLIKALRKLSNVKKAWPSQANFLLVKFKYNIEKKCKEKGVILRNMTQSMGQKNIVRISIGKPEDNIELLQTLKEINA